MNRNTRLLTVALIVSVGLNLFFGGLWVGGRWRSHDGFIPFAEGSRGHRGGIGLGAMFRELPVELRDQLRAQIRAGMPQTSDLHSAESAAHREILDALSTDPFAPDRLDKALGELREAQSSRRALVHAAIVDIARKVSNEDRAAMRRGLEKMLTHDRPWKHNRTAPRDGVPSP